MGWDFVMRAVFVYNLYVQKAWVPGTSETFIYIFNKKNGCWTVQESV